MAAICKAVIAVVNKGNHKPTPHDVYVGRGSIFGNPYDHTGSNHYQVQFRTNNRDESVKCYEKHFIETINSGDPNFCGALNDLIIKKLKNQPIYLVCFCAPKLCHADVIKTYVENARYCLNWFSNMRKMKPMSYQGIQYHTVENFYQAMKVHDLDRRAYIASLTPFNAKSEGRKLDLREDWEDVKMDVMSFALRHKFARATHWGDMLEFSSGPIVEWNNWGDTFWGKDCFTKQGENMLGKILMEIRES